MVPSRLITRDVITSALSTTFSVPRMTAICACSAALAIVDHARSRKEASGGGRLRDAVRSPGPKHSGKHKSAPPTATSSDIARSTDLPDFEGLDEYSRFASAIRMLI